jgi:hypothetical protein
LGPGGGSDDKTATIEPDHYRVPGCIDGGFVRQGEGKMAGIGFIVVEIVAWKTELEKSELEFNRSKRLRSDGSAPAISPPHSRARGDTQIWSNLTPHPI